MKLDELEKLKRTDHPFPVYGRATLSSQIEAALSGNERTIVMGPLVPRPAPFKCYIRHADGRCTCSAPIIKREDMAETCTQSAMYVLGTIKKQAVPGKLSREDLDYLTWRVSMIAAHWGRLALGHEELV